MSKIDRLPKNVDGDFYTTGYKDKNGEWVGSCLFCGLPEGEAPDLLAPLNDKNCDTYFIKQPSNSVELDQAIASTEVCCVDAIRYGGKEKSILRRVNPALTDYKISIFGFVVPNKPWFF